MEVRREGGTLDSKVGCGEGSLGLLATKFSKGKRFRKASP